MIIYFRTVKGLICHSLIRIVLVAVISVFSSVLLASPDCDAYKLQVVNNCDAMRSQVDIIAQNNTFIYGIAQGSSDTANANLIMQTCGGINNSCLALTHQITSLRNTAESLQCSTNSAGSCDCSQKLDDISSVLSEIKDILDFMEDDTTSILNFLQTDLSDSLSGISDSLDSYFGYYTNFVSKANVGVLGGNSRYYFKQTSGNPSLTQTNSLYPFNAPTQLQNATHESFLRYSLLQLFNAVASLNNYFYSNTLAIASIYGYLPHLTNQVSSTPLGLEYVVEVDRPPLLDHSSTDYFSALTNSYLATWSANDNPNTNWFRRVELLLASLVFRDSGHQDDLEDIEDDLPSSSELSSLEDSLDASEMFDVDIGGQFFDNPPSLPDFGSQLPQSLVITIPSYGGNDSQSASTALRLEIDVDSISPLCEAIRACFRFLWWGLVALFVFFLGRWFLRGCSFAFKLIQGIHFS